MFLHLWYQSDILYLFSYSQKNFDRITRLRPGLRRAGRIGFYPVNPLHYLTASFYLLLHPVSCRVFSFPLWFIKPILITS
jgi:hypothetical protein